MNSVILMGRLTRDPEIRYSEGSTGQMCIARYTLAVDRRQNRNTQNNGQPTADFIRCVAFGQRGEFAEKYMHQGMRMLISGSLQTGSYQNKDGQTIYTTDVIVNSQEFADSKGAGTANNTHANSTTAANTNSVSAGPDTFGEGFMTIPDGVEDEGLPFN